jgi:tRNA nucleotidyltransferase (CCA-adding enzyme)
MMHPKHIVKVALAIHAAGGKSFFVGGCVRDFFLGCTPKDFDIEVFGLDLAELTAVLATFGKVDTVGRSFGVIKLTMEGHDTIDFSMPQHRIKVADGHKGEQVVLDKGMSIREAAQRRDFTINSMSVDVLTGTLHDPFGGLRDLEARILRHVGPAFAEDPLRVLRGVQFAARFQMRMAPETVELCRSLLPQFESLPKERIWEEFSKLLDKGTKVSMGLDVLAATGWIEKFPALAAMEACPQNPAWHPEGPVGAHVRQVVDRVR